MSASPALVETTPSDFSTSSSATPRAQPGTGSGRSQRGQATRLRIIVTAAALFHERGVAGISLDDIGAASRTSKSQLYHYFDNKSALVLAVVSEQAERLLGAQLPELSALDSMEGLRRWARCVVALHEKDQRSLGCPLGRLVLEVAGSNPETDTALSAAFTTWQARIAEGLQAMQEQGELGPEADPALMAFALLAAVQGGLLLARAVGTLTPLKAALDLALVGVQAQLNTTTANIEGTAV